MNMDNPYDVIKNLRRTEKGTVLQKDNKYIFAVDKTANKFKIKRAIEEIYKVKVEKINTCNMFGKWKKVRMAEGRKPDWKKAVVTLRKGEMIEVK